MAAILEKLLARELSPDRLKAWLKSSRQQENILEPSDNLENVRYGFVPYFLNYLRDQSSHLLQGSRSTSTTPAKTPTTAKLRRLTTFSASEANSSSSHPIRRQQLFSVSETKEKVSIDSPCTRVGSVPRKLPRNRIKEGGFVRSQRSIQFTEGGHKSKHKTSLGDFLKSPDTDNRTKASPSNAHVGAHHSRKLSNRSRPTEKRDKLTSDDITLDPKFSLNNDKEFPPMTSDERLIALPEGARVITPSRRIVPTHVTSSSKNNDNVIFKNAPIMASGPSKARGVWGQVANRSFTQHDSGSKEQKKNKQHRRIAPTLISDNITASSDSSIVFNSSSETSTQNTVEEDVLIKEEKSENLTELKQCEAEEPSSNIICVPVLTDGLAVTPTKFALDQQTSVEVVTAEKDKVTNQDILDVLIEVYSFCINAFLVPNVAVELYFLVQLLTAHGTDTGNNGNNKSKDLEDIPYFISIHNAVYFSVSVLAKIARILCHLDRGTLRLLMDNQRIADFLPKLRDTLSQFYNQVPCKMMLKSLPSPIGGVSFQADTDNRKNFPNERSFHLFKKQRDGFYELLREWEENHLTPGWSMSEVQGERIQNLIGYKTELANHIHFVRLFQSQLIQMCKGDNSWQKDEEDENIELLSELKQTNPKKLKRLRERLVTPALHGGPCPNPSFPGCQEFFRDFISAAYNPFFNHLLSDQLLHKILEMNDVQFISMEVAYDEDKDIIIDADDREMLLNCVLTTKLLAKFLGFVSFLPYYTPEVLPEGLQTSYINIRNKSSQPVDIKHHLTTAQHKGRTVLTVPWVVEYLSMMDPSANQLTYFQDLFSLLVNIYREASDAFQAKHSSSYLLVLTVLGWLFELPCFPERQVFTEVCSSTPVQISRLALDNLNIIDQHILYSCCPYLGEVRSVLVDFAVGVNGRSSSVRKITPVTAESLVDSCPTTITHKQLQHQLEDNFFHNQPASLKKTVEFIADRVSSNHIKAYRTQTLPHIFIEARQQVPQIAEEIVQLHTECTSSGQKEIQQSVEKRASDLASKAKALCIESAPRYCSVKCRDALSLLLPDEMPEQAWRIAALISYRQALDKVNTWLNTQITTHMFKKELLVTSDLEKQVRNLTKKNLEKMSVNVQPSFDLSNDVSGFRHSSSTQMQINNPTVMASAIHNSFMFESPIRALQNIALRPRTSASESPVDYLLQPMLANQSISSSPTSKCIRNLSSFDKEPVTNPVVNIQCSTSKVLDLAKDMDPKHSGQPSGLPRPVLTDEHLIESVVCNKLGSSVNEMKKKRVDCIESFQSLAGLNISVMGSNSMNSSENSDASENCHQSDVLTRGWHDVLPINSKLWPYSETEEVTKSLSISGTCSNPTNTKGSDSTDDICGHVTCDVELLSKTGNSSSTSSILNRSGSGGKKLNVYFHETPTSMTEGLGVVFTHSTPQTSPTKVVHRINVVMDSSSLSATSILSSPTELLIAMKECVRCVIQEPGSVTSSYIYHLLLNAVAVFQKSNDQVITLTSKMMSKLSLDLALVLAIQQPKLMTSEIQDAVLTFWELSNVKKYLDFSSVLCANHLQHLEKGNQTYVYLVRTILEKHFMDLTVLVESASHLFNNKFMKPKTNEILCEFICDLLSSLPDEFLCSDRLLDFIMKLANQEMSGSRKEILTTLMERMQTLKT